MKSIAHYTIGKMSRSELEGAYFDLLNENLMLKKTVHKQSKEIKRLEILFRNHNISILQKDGNAVTPTLDDIRMKDIQLRNKYLIEKVNVLTHQLLQQSHFHAQAHRCIRKLSPRYGYDKKSFANETKENRELQYNVADKLNKIESYLAEEDELSSTNNKHSDYNNSSQEPTGSYTKNYECLADNVDNLRWRVLIRNAENEKEMISANAEGEITALRKAIQLLNDDYENICAQLGQAHIKHSELQSELVELNSLKKSYRMLEEKLRDTKEEREMLREVNGRLLALSENGEENQQTSHKVSFEMDFRD